jgi:hypothetical protein
MVSISVLLGKLKNNAGVIVGLQVNNAGSFRVRANFGYGGLRAHTKLCLRFLGAEVT